MRQHPQSFDCGWGRATRRAPLAAPGWSVRRRGLPRYRSGKRSSVTRRRRGGPGHRTGGVRCRRARWSRHRQLSQMPRARAGTSTSSSRAVPADSAVSPSGECGHTNLCPLTRREGPKGLEAREGLRLFSAWANQPIRLGARTSHATQHPAGLHRARSALSIVTASLTCRAGGIGSTLGHGLRFFPR